MDHKTAIFDSFSVLNGGMDMDFECGSWLLVLSSTKAAVYLDASLKVDLIYAYGPNSAFLVSYSYFKSKCQ